METTEPLTAIDSILMARVDDRAFFRPRMQTKRSRSGACPQDIL